jgi:hypothetical protein
MFLKRRTQEEAPEVLRELTDEELTKVAGGVMCVSEPGMKVYMWFATAWWRPLARVAVTLPAGGELAPRGPIAPT